MNKQTTKAEARQDIVEDARRTTQEGIYMLIDLRDEVQAIHDSLEEYFSATERFERVGEAIEQLDEMIDYLENAASIDIEFHW
mgnify:FL=1